MNVLKTNPQYTVIQNEDYAAIVADEDRIQIITKHHYVWFKSAKDWQAALKDIHLDKNAKVKDKYERRTVLEDGLAFIASKFHYKFIGNIAFELSYGKEKLLLNKKQAKKVCKYLFGPICDYLFSSKSTNKANNLDLSGFSVPLLSAPISSGEDNWISLSASTRICNTYYYYSTLHLYGSPLAGAIREILHTSANDTTVLSEFKVGIDNIKFEVDDSHIYFCINNEHAGTICFSFLHTKAFPELVEQVFPTIPAYYIPNKLLIPYKKWKEESHVPPSR
jgi:hypothetical protein